MQGDAERNMSRRSGRQPVAEKSAGGGKVENQGLAGEVVGHQPGHLPERPFLFCSGRVRTAPIGTTTSVGILIGASMIKTLVKTKGANMVYRLQHSAVRKKIKKWVPSRYRIKVENRFQLALGTYGLITNVLG